jgi:hypothetical protein
MTTPPEKPTLENVPEGLSRSEDVLRDVGAVGARFPVGFRFLEEEKRFELISKIRPRSLPFFLLFTLFWAGFMVVWFSISIASGHWEMAAFGSIHGLVGVGLTYAVLRQLLNRTHFEVEEDRLVVRHRPFGWPGSFELKRERLKQLYVTQGEAYRVNGRPVMDYRVKAVLRGSAEKVLVKGLKTYEQARFIEQEIERVWQIEDESKPGEVT